MHSSANVLFYFLIIDKLRTLCAAASPFMVPAMPVHFSKQRQPTVLTREVGSLIRSIRETKRLTQNNLADRTGRSLQMIGRIERGVSAPSFETLEALANALDVSVGAFFQVGPFMAGDGNEPLARIVARLSRLDADDLEWTDELIKIALGRKVRAASEA